MRKRFWGCCLAGLWWACSTTGQTSIVDPSFNPGSGANGLVETVVPLPDGKILICGNFSSYNGVSSPNIARLNHNGSLDSTFRASPGYWVRHLSVQPDGKIVIGGFFTTVQAQPRNRIARLNSDGSLDTTFNPGTGAFGTLGISITGNADPFVFYTAIQPDGKILITGNFTNYNGTVIYGIARINPNGSLDTTFNVGSGLNSWGRSIQVLPNNQILVTGWFGTYRNTGHHRMALINPDGSPDSSLNPFFGDSTSIYTAALLSNGNYIVAGHSINAQGFFRQDIARLNPNGSFDATFNASANDKVESVRIEADGKIILGGYFNVVNGQLRRNIARLNPDGTLDPAFQADIDNFIWTVALDRDGRIMIAGGFSRIDGQSRNGVARLLSVPGAPLPEDTTRPSLQIISPSASTVQVSSPSITLSGTASDASGIERISVTVQGGSAGPVTGTTIWSVPLALAAGTNSVSITARDRAGNETTVSRSFVYVSPPEDTTRPSLQIISPSASTVQVGSPSLTLSGTASDAGGIERINVTVQGGSAGPVTGTTNWSVPLALAAGTNSVSITVRDRAGNETTVSRSFVLITAFSATIQGMGSVAPNLNAQLLRIGSFYRLTARPAAGHLFTGWTGGSQSTSPSLRFQMQEGLQLQANFIPNPFLERAGTYTGLFGAGDTNTAATSGFVRLVLSSRGTFSGRVQAHEKAYSFTGRFNFEGISQVVISRRGQAPLILNLQWDEDSIAGTVSDGSFNSALVAYRASYGPARPATAYTGRHTLLFPGGPARAFAGHGFATMSINRYGSISFQGILADGTVINTTTTLATNGLAPLYLSRPGQSTVYGWLEIGSESGEVSGTLHWEKGTNRTTPTRVVEDFQMIGSKYMPTGTFLGDFTNPVVVLEDGNLSAPVTATLTSITRNQARFNAPDGSLVTVNLVPSSGAINGTFMHPATHRATTFRGVLVQREHYGGGFFLNSGESGSLFLGESGGPRIPLD